MKTPYICGRIPPRVKPAENTNAETRVQELQSALVRERINHKNDLRRLADEHIKKLEHLQYLLSCAAYEKHEALQRQRWYMGALCFVFLLVGIVLGDVLAPYDLR